VQLGAVHGLLIHRGASAAATATTTSPATGGGRGGYRIQLVVHIFQVGVLQGTAVGIDLYLWTVQFLPDALADGSEEFDRAVCGAAVDGFLFNQAGKTLAVEQGGEHGALGGVDAVDGAVGFDEAQNFRIDNPLRSGEGVLYQESYGLLLADLGNQGVDAVSYTHLDVYKRQDLGNQGVDGAFLSHHFLLAVEAAWDLRHVAHFGAPLTDHPAIEFGEFFVGVAFLVRGGRHQHSGDALQVLDPERGGENGIGIADGFGFIAGVGTGGAGSGETQIGFVVLLFGPLVERGLLLVLSLGAGNGSVAPLGGPDVVGADARNQVCLLYTSRCV